MSLSARTSSQDLVDMSAAAVGGLEAILADATAAVRARVSQDGRVVSRLLDREQRATHGLAWLATYGEAVRQLAAYAQRLAEAGRLVPGAPADFSVFPTSSVDQLGYRFDVLPTRVYRQGKPVSPSTLRQYI